MPRLDDFCWIGVQEPNVYGGLAVAMPFIYSRPRYFAEIIGELLYWLDEDRILFARLRYLAAQVARRDAVDFQIPLEDLQGEYGTLTPDIKRRLGLNAARLYDIEVPSEIRKKEPVMAERRAGVSGETTLMLTKQRSWTPSRASGTELDEPITDLKFISDLRVGGDSVDDVRLPTPFCALTSPT